MPTEPIRVIFFDLGETLVTGGPAWMPAAQQLLGSLGPKFRLGIISNTGPLPDRAAVQRLLPPDFDLARFEPALVLFSSEVGVEKPDCAIFEAAIARAQVPAGQCLFVSEDALDTLVAQRAGMRSICVQTRPGGELRTIEAVIDRFNSLA